MKLVVGLGNPGTKYTGTRHNIGFEVLFELAKRTGAVGRAKFQGEFFDGRCENHRLLMLCPHTFMNLSGSSVLAARDFYKLDNESLLVVCDDFSLPLGRLRVRAKGSSGGQKGLEDIIRRLGTEDFPRLRIGIGLPPEGRSAADFVLSRFSETELPVVRSSILRAADAVSCWLRDGTQMAMNQFNGS
jgi:PTH1 family peptidyl-tRNA hydrolase